MRYFAIFLWLMGPILMVSTGRKDEKAETEARANSNTVRHKSSARQDILTKVPETFDPLIDIIHFEAEMGDQDFDSAVCLMVKVPTPLVMTTCPLRLKRLTSM